MGQGQLEMDLHVDGLFSCKKIAAPSGAFTDTHIAGNAGIQTSKMDHRYVQVVPLSANRKSTDAVVAGRYVVALVRSANGATLKEIRGGHVTPPTGTGKYSFNLLRNGVSILQTGAAVDVDIAVAARGSVAAIINDPSAVQNDLYELDITINAGTGVVANGGFVVLYWDQKP